MSDLKNTTPNDNKKKVKKFVGKRGKNSEKKLSQKIEDTMLPIFAKVGSFPILVTIRDAFALMIPVIIAGSLGILGSAFLFGGGATGSSLSTSVIGWIAKWSGFVETSTGDGGTTLWALQGAFADVADIGNKLFSIINTATMGALSLYASFFIAWRWAALKDSQNPILAGLTGLASFLIITEVNPFFFDATGLLATLLISFITSQLFIIFERSKKIQIKLPSSVPPTVSKGFAALFPIVFVLLIVASLNTIAWSIGLYANLDIESKGEVVFAAGEYGFAGLFFRFISAPFLAFASSSSGGLGIGMFYISMYGLFWFFGIHGGNVLNGVFYPVWFGLISTNAQAIADGMSATDPSLAVFNMAFWETYVMTTGWGITGAMVLGTIIFSKQQKYKELNKICGPAAIFNINEPVTFGYPLMLNPILGLAAIPVMPIFTIVAWLFVGPLGLVSKSYIYAPWTMPVGIGALFSSGMDWKAAVLAIGIFVGAFIYYIPFILINEKYENKLAAAALSKQEPKESISKEAEDIFAAAAKKGK
ncbi:PTS sugar transporter subunit IIC [Mesoplasma photuris]|uniref:PTS sugar transporter subunit IIC n=1 Tax=Mesoplasma photuris TaxID=217731 RepID=UPI0004E25902|nr:PTS transporter subunit EIIC [Mesoplasma photuris]